MMILKLPEDLSFLDVIFDVDEPPQSVNVFQLSGFPQRELVASRIWAYFLDPSERHGLGTLFLEVLIPLLQEQLDERGKALLDGIDVSSADDWLADTEVVTDRRNRIDLLLSSPSLGIALAIENKVLVPVNNPLDDYREYAEENLKSNDAGGNGYCILLSTSQIVGDGPDVDAYVTYDDVLAKAMARLPSRLSTADARSLDILMQFIDNYSEKAAKMISKIDEEVGSFLEQLEGKDRDVREFLMSIGELSAILKSRGKRLLQLINDIFSEGVMVDSSGRDIVVEEEWPTLKKCAQWQSGKTWYWSDGTRIAGLREGRTAMFVALGLSDKPQKGPAVELILGLSPNISGDEHGSGVRIKAYDKSANNHPDRLDIDHEPLAVRYADSDEEILRAFFNRAEIYARQLEGILEP